MIFMAEVGVRVGWVRVGGEGRDGGYHLLNYLTVKSGLGEICQKPILCLRHLMHQRQIKQPIHIISAPLFLGFIFSFL